MLKQLRVRNLAVIESLDLDFESGFTALTGETGAGKSILLGALKCILGARMKSDLIRQGEDKLRVEALFDCPPSPAFKTVLEKLELDPEESELVLEREMNSQGRNRCRINGSVVTLNALEEVGTYLVDLHGQHEQQSLLDPRTHLGYLDGFAGLDHKVLAYRQRYFAWRDADARLKSAEAEARRVREQMEFIQFQVKELEKASLSLGEEDRIESELKLQSGMEKVAAGLAASLALIDTDGSGILQQLGKLTRELQALRKFVEPNPFMVYDEALETARQSLGDLRTALRQYRLPNSADSANLDALNAKLALIQRLKSKYQSDMNGLIALREKRKQELALAENAEITTADLRSKRDTAFEAAREAAAELTQKRHAATQKFVGAVHAVLKSLAMEGCVFAAELNRLTTPETRNTDDTQAPSPTGSSETVVVGLNDRGADRLEFFLSANPGEPPKPLTKIASGGEVSRVMLALKVALAAGDPRPLLVFDELDTGIGGVTAHKVGAALHELSAHHQLLVITHLHQVAAQAKHQQRVVKGLEGGRTVTRVIPLTSEERVGELARMMGDENSKATLKHARELLAAAP